MTILKPIAIKVTKAQCREFGQVATLAVLSFAIHFKSNELIMVAWATISVTIVLPIVFYPFAFVWFNISGLMSKVVPVIMLSIIYFLMVVPVGLIRKLLNRDRLRLRQFKKDNTSVMVDRNHEYTAADLLHTF